MTSPTLELQQVSVYYGNQAAIEQASLTVQAGELMALVGPSGCGKSSLLASINRMTDSLPGCRVSGTIMLGGEALSASQDATALRRRIGMVFQQPNPFPLSIIDNLRFPLAEHGVPVEVLAVELADPEDTRQRVAGALLADATIDGMLTLGTTGAEPALAALQDLGRVGDVHLGTFDLSTSVLEAIRDGEIDFAIDQQQYLQGYLPVVLLTLYIETGTVPGGGLALPTGPGFVTSETAQQVMDLTSRGLR